MDYEKYELGTVSLLSGEKLDSAFLIYKTYGKLNKSKDNVVVLPTFYTGSHQRNEGFFGVGKAIDPEKHFVVSINMFGNGFSSSPSNTPAPQAGLRFPHISLWDNIACQYKLLTEHLEIARIALVTGWSMAGCQAYQWAAQYPDFVDAILPFCASAKHRHITMFFLKASERRFVQTRIGIKATIAPLQLMVLKPLQESMRVGLSLKPFIATLCFKKSVMKLWRTC